MREGIWSVLLVSDLMNEEMKWNGMETKELFDDDAVLEYMRLLFVKLLCVCYI